MGYLTLKVTKRRNGTEYSRFLDTLGRRVGTSAAMLPGGGGNWVRADQLAYLAAYGIELQQEQLDAGLGSDGAPMPPLHETGRLTTFFVERRNKKAIFESLPYPQAKIKLGLKPIRDLYGPGGSSTYYKDLSPRAKALLMRHGIVPPPRVKRTILAGHMRDDIRINYVDDRQAKIGITTTASRIKALANERRAPWWGWSPASMAKMNAAAAGIFNVGLGEHLVSVGLASSNFMVQLAKQLNFRTATFRRAA